MQDKKKQKRVSFATEEPEKNTYEREQTFNSITTDDITVDLSIDQTKIRNSFFDETKFISEDNELLELKIKNSNIVNNKDTVDIKTVNIDFIKEDTFDKKFENVKKDTLDLKTVNMDFLKENTLNKKIEDFDFNKVNLINENNLELEQIKILNEQHKKTLENPEDLKLTHPIIIDSINSKPEINNSFSKNNSFIKTVELKKSSINYNENEFENNYNINKKTSIEANKSSFMDEKENETIMSNTTVVFDELVNTQCIKKMVNPKLIPTVNLNEILMDIGIRFLDDIVVSSTRRETLSKSRKDIDPSLINYYKFFLTHRISFFDTFSEYIKDNLLKLQESIKNIELNFSIKGTLLETDDKSNLRSLKTDCRNRATVSWYDIRAKKELEFNEMIIDKRNELINVFNEKEIELDKLVNKKRDMEETFNDLELKLNNLNSVKNEINCGRKFNELSYKLEGLENEQNNENLFNKNNKGQLPTDIQQTLYNKETNEMELSIKQLNEDISDHEKVLESYRLELNKLQEQYNTKKMKEEVQERKEIELKNEIQELEKQFKNTTVSEHDLNRIRTEYEKTVTLLGLNFIEYNSEIINLEFLNIYTIKLTKDNLQIDCKNTNDICQYSKYICQGMSSLKEIIYKLSLLHEFYTELQLINNFISSNSYMQNDKLIIKLGFNDIKSMQEQNFVVEINKNLEVVIKKEEESFMYNLYYSKGCLFDHII